MSKNANEKKRVIVKIMGAEYVLRSSNSPEHMLEVGEHVNLLMEDLAEKHPTMSMQKIAVLASMNLASDLLLQKSNKRGSLNKNRKAQSKSGE